MEIPETLKPPSPKPMVIAQASTLLAVKVDLTSEALAGARNRRPRQLEI